uniref:Endosome-associated-trafficking regulator 1 n=1 Tax=Glossina pallidipes TaxID=7398 RepID=A0A1B0A3X5_GLOPL
MFSHLDENQLTLDAAAALDFRARSSNKAFLFCIFCCVHGCFITSTKVMRPSLCLRSSLEMRSLAPVERNNGDSEMAEKLKGERSTLSSANAFLKAQKALLAAENNFLKSEALKIKAVNKELKTVNDALKEKNSKLSMNNTELANAFVNLANKITKISRSSEWAHESSKWAQGKLK